MWANAVVLSWGNLLPFRPSLHYSFYCVYLCKKPNLNYFQSGQKYNYRCCTKQGIVNSRKMRHQSSQRSIPHSAFLDKSVTQISAGFLKPSHLQKPHCLVHISSAQGYSLFNRIVNSTIALQCLCLRNKIHMKMNSSRNQIAVSDGQCWRPTDLPIYFPSMDIFCWQRKMQKGNTTALKCHGRRWPVCWNFISFSPWWVREAGNVHTLLSKK